MSTYSNTFENYTASQQISHGSKRLLANEFCDITREHFLMIHTSHIEVTNVYNKFTNQTTVFPQDCANSFKVMQVYQNQVRDFCRAIESQAQLPIIIISKRYKLLLVLHFVNEQIQHILPLLSDLRRICLEPSKQCSILYKQIQNRLESVVQSSNRIEEEFAELLEQADMND